MHNFNFFAEKPSSTYRKSDSHFLILVILLWGIGIVTLYFCSMTYGLRFHQNPFHSTQRQLVSSFIGLLFMIFFAVIDIKKLRNILPFIVLGSLFLCILTFIPGIGVERNGARRWIRIPYFSTFQPSEAIKFSMVLYLANLFDKQRNCLEEERSDFPAVIGLVVFGGIVFAQQDFSTGIFIIGSGLLLFFVSGVKLKMFIPLAGLAIPFFALFILLEPYRVNRIVGFLAPDSYEQTLNWQVNGAKRAIIDGGLFGQGIGTGLTKLGGVPEIQSDYIFAGWAEAMGLFGVAVYIAILSAFAYRVIKISLHCGNYFAALSSFGFGMMIVLQSLVNIGVAGGVLPSTGIPLPFFSSGGSSIIFTLAMCGFILNASRIEEGNEFEIFYGEGIR